MPSLDSVTDQFHGHLRAAPSLDDVEDTGNYGIRRVTGDDEVARDDGTGVGGLIQERPEPAVTVPALDRRRGYPTQRPLHHLRRSLCGFSSCFGANSVSSGHPCGYPVISHADVMGDRRTRLRMLCGAKGVSRHRR